MRRVAYVTGTRADYGLFSEPLKRIREHPRLELSLIVTGMHLEPEFGSTIKEIEADAMPIAARVKNLTGGDTGADQARSVGNALLGITDALVESRPDLLIVLGDRAEMLAGAIAAAHLNIAVAHVHGGDVSGTVDDLVRDAITKLSHVHFAATEDAAARLRGMGEQPERVHVTGAPGLDYLSRFEPIPIDQLAQELGFDPKRPFLIFTQHPVTLEMDAATEQMEASLAALEAADVQVVATYPNADAGGRAMIGVLDRWKNRDWLHVTPNLGRHRYASLLKSAAAMAGNSSSGIIEAPFFGVPVVNIGTRQEGRQRADNVLDVGYDREAIRKSVVCALSDESFIARARHTTNPYGDGHAGERIVEVLASLEVGPGLLSKRPRTQPVS
jgi:GDP/UDP-N,N'-diacetylbacillosamine 2-epimerase (hydrolysing)